jgi:ectoine hydroxylase-related dioxygenase (phytanoyl-CoA dioxygenase family)
MTTSNALHYRDTSRGSIALSEAIESYRVDGACCLRGIVSPKWIDALRLALKEGAAAPTSLSKDWRAPDGSGRLFQDVFVWRKLEALRRFALESGVASIVASVLQTKELRLYSDHVFVRDAGTSKETPWHQDESYCFVAGRHFCSLWLPLDGVSRSESLQLVKGSHAWDTVYAPIEFASRLDYEGSEGRAQRVPKIDARRQEIMGWDMQPGDCILFSARTLHGSSACPPEAGPRRVYVTRWIGDDATYRRHPWTVPPMPTDPELCEGDRFSGELFPIAYRSGDVIDAC